MLSNRRIGRGDSRLRGRCWGAPFVAIVGSACAGTPASSAGVAGASEGGAPLAPLDAGGVDGVAPVTADAGLGAGSGGADGAAPSTPPPPPDVPPGTPITAPDGVWTNIPFPQGYCRDGTPAHLMVHLNSASTKVAIYEEGGGACFNDGSCLMTFDFPSYTLGQGIFNFANAENPIADWNIFYVPYCTGDVHAGNNLAANPGSSGPTKYTGYTNLELYLARILATVPGATDWLLTGSSAGGFGAGLTVDLIARNLPPSVERFTLLDDSGPPMSSTYVPPCLQGRWSSTWGFGDSVLKDCGLACPDPSDYTTAWMQFILNKYAKGPDAARFMGGLISSTSDAIISMFFGFGADGCTAASPVSLTGPVYEAGLLDIRYWAKEQTDRFGTFYYGSSAHTTLMLDNGIQLAGVGLLGGLYDTQVNGVKLTDWIRDLLAHAQAAHVGP